MEELMSGLVAKAGLTDEQAKKVVEFLKENASDVPKWLASGNIKGAIADKLPGGLGGLLG